MFELAGRTAIVTGGADGIGAAIVRRLAAAGARVLIVDRNEQRARALAAEVGGKACIADATDASRLATLFGEISAAEPGIDILVNNVGGGPRGRLDELSIADWQACLSLNLTSAFVATQGVLAAMRRRGGGAIVNVSSIAAHPISPVGGAAYAAAKAGLLALTRQTAYEWARYRIRANAVCPGPTRTALTSNSSRVPADFPLGAWIEPSDVADAVLFLAGASAGMCSGSVLTVDGASSLF